MDEAHVSANCGLSSRLMIIVIESSQDSNSSCNLSSSRLLSTPRRSEEEYKEREQKEAKFALQKGQQNCKRESEIENIYNEVFYCISATYKSHRSSSSSSNRVPLLSGDSVRSNLSSLLL